MPIPEPRMTLELKRRIERAGNVAKLAQEWGISKVSIYNALKGQDSLGRRTGISDAIAGKMGFRRVVMFERVKK